MKHWLKPWGEIHIPSLSLEEKQRLKNSIDKYGLKRAILVLPDGRIIDGRHRWEILGDNIPEDKIEILDLSDEGALALAYSLNMDRRQLSYEQLKEVRERLVKTALKLRSQGMTQKKASEITGVPRRTISHYESKGNVANTCVPDLRVKVDSDSKDVIVARAESGETNKAIADDFKISHQRVSQIVSAAKTAKQKKKEKTETKEIQRKALARDIQDFSDVQTIKLKLSAIHDKLQYLINMATKENCTTLNSRLFNIQKPTELLRYEIKQIEECVGGE